MADMLVRLYDLPPLEPLLEQQRQLGIDIRRPIAPERHIVLNWVQEHFGALWVSECEVGFGHAPPTLYIATQHDRMIGFACYDTTAKAMFGPTGVAENSRGQGTGKALLLMALWAMYYDGYMYGIIGWPGPVDFYAKAVGATVIENSSPGPYRGMLRDDKT